MLLTWDVGQHDNDEAVVVVKRHVILVWEPHGVHSRPAYEWQRSINGEQLTNDSHRVQDNEEVVSGGRRKSRMDVFKSSSVITLALTQLGQLTVRGCYYTHMHIENTGR